MKKNILENLQLFLLPALAIFIVLVLFFVFFIPRVRQVFEQRGKILKQDEEIRRLTQKYSELSTLSEAELWQDSDLLFGALPSQKDFYQSLSVIRRICLENGVNVEAFELAPGVISATASSALTKNTEKVPNMMAKVIFSSSFENLKNVLLKFEETLPLMEVVSLKYEPGLRSSGSFIAQATNLFIFSQGEMVIKSYFLPLPLKMGAFDQPLVKITAADQKLIEKLKTFQRFTPEASFEGETVVGRENPFSF